MHGAQREPVRWFLDIDGTIAPVGRSGWNGPTLYGGPAHSDLAVPYRPRLIKSIQNLHVSGVVEVVWLTTWAPDEIDAWTKVGLGPFRIIRRHKAGRDRWWKADSVQTWMRKHPHERVVWTDDDISVGGLRGLDKRRLLWIAPHPESGLTDQHIARIRAWVEPEGASLR